MKIFQNVIILLSFLFFLMQAYQIVNIGHTVAIIRLLLCTSYPHMCSFLSQRISP